MFANIPPDDHGLTSLLARARASVARALRGELFAEIRCVTVELEPGRLRVLVGLDANVPDEVKEDFDAGMMTQVHADFCWPERGDPEISHEFVLMGDSADDVLPPGTCVYSRDRDLA